MKRAVLLLLTLALIAAGCGSGPKSPGVASLGGGHTTTTSSSSAPPGGGFSTGNPHGGRFQMKLAGGVKFSQCMRAHGVRNFPDPSATGGLTIDSSSGIDPNSPTFRRAQQACAKDLPNGGKPTPQQLAQAKQAALAFSACMRAHGVKDFPDPSFRNGGIAISIHGGPGTGMDKNNPTFQRAQAACGNLFKKP